MGGSGKLNIRGTDGEALAARYLETQRLKVVHRGYQTRWGEIDLICQAPDQTWVFVEVKSRAHAAAISAADAITPAKQKKIIGAALNYMKKHRLVDQAMRFDVILIEGSQLEWLPGAFEAEPRYSF